MTDRDIAREDQLGASTFLEKGWSLISLGDYPAAEEALSRALELTPRDARASALLAWSLMHQGKFDAADAAIQKALEQQSSNALAHVCGGYIAYRRGDFAGAIALLTRAAQIGNDPKATLYANLYLGIIYLRREMYSDASVFLRTAVKLGPNLIEAYYYLGRALYRTGLPDEAKDAWRHGAISAKRNRWGVRCEEILAAVEKGLPFPHPL